MWFQISNHGEIPSSFYRELWWWFGTTPSTGIGAVQASQQSKHAASGAFIVLIGCTYRSPPGWRRREPQRASRGLGGASAAGCFGRMLPLAHVTRGTDVVQTSLSRRGCVESKF